MKEHSSEKAGADLTHVEGEDGHDHDLHAADNDDAGDDDDDDDDDAADDDDDPDGEINHLVASG